MLMMLSKVILQFSLHEIGLPDTAEVEGKFTNMLHDITFLS